MSRPAVLLHRSLLRFLRAAALVLALGLLAAACSETEEVPAAVAEQLDIENNAIADLTAEGAEQVDRIAILQAVNRARDLGTDLRVVIAGRDDELVSASALVSRYGGTALSYKANDTAFEAASRDVAGDQIDEAIVPAGQAGDIGGSVTAFVDVLEAEGLQEPGPSWWRIFAIVLLVVSFLFMVWQLLRFRRVRRRAAKRRREFDERKQVLRDWAERLEPEVAAVEGETDTLSESAETTLGEARDFAGKIVAKVDDAETIGDLDAAEMRIGRTYIKLRDLRRDLTR